MNITITKEKALDLLTKHKEHHIAAHTEAKKGWEDAMEKHSQELTKWALAGGVDKDRPREPQKPVNYTGEYDKLINMLKHHILDTIELEESDYDQIVKDKFGWSRGFIASNSTYLGDSVGSYFNADLLDGDDF